MGCKFFAGKLCVVKNTGGIVIGKKWMIAIWIIIFGLYIQPILAQAVAENLTATVNTFAGEEGNKVLKGNFIITENEGKDQNINISFTDLIEENSDQVLDKSRINVISADLNKDKSKYAVAVKGYGVWVGEISINTTGIKSGTYNGKAIIEGANFTPLDVGLSVKLAKPTWQKLVVLSLAAISIIFAVFLILLVKDPKYGTLLALIPVVVGTLLLYMFPLFDAQENTLLTTSFFVPLAACIFDFLKGRRDDRLVLEKSVAGAKAKAIGDAVDFHSALLEEINTHAATFSCIDGIGANPLEDAVWKEGKKKAGLVSDFPGYRLARYYQYIDDFNKYLNARNTGPKSLEDPTNFVVFCREFRQLNKAYKELEDILYLNLFYNIGSFQYKLRSFKEIEVPFHIPYKLRQYLAEITGVAEEKINNDKIYKEKVAMKLMKEIEKQFKENYKNLQETLQELSKFKIHNESAAETSNAKKTKAA
jgi:hypothetical protein